MTIQKLVAGASVADPLASTGADVASAVNGLIDLSGMGSNPVVYLGIDSLTDGSGGFSYNTVLEKLARGVVGWGGRWIAFTDPTAWGEFTIFKSGTTNIAGLPMSDSRRARSLDGKGFFAAAGADSTYLIEPNFNWAYADVYYLQQPSGGSFQLDRPAGQAAITVNTDGPLSIQKVRITKNLRNGTATNNNAIRVRQNPVVAEIVCYGAVYYSGDDGPVYINAAIGGRKTSDQVLFDSAFQQQWFAMLGVTHAVINAGMNDRSVSNAATFQADLTTVLGRFPTDTKIILQRPNNPTDAQLTQYNVVYPTVAEQFNAQYIDTLALFGDFAAFSARGWMIDGVHPNQHYQIRQAQEACKALFGKCRYENTPAVINYVGGDPQ
jgi:hypothetical protein